MSAKHTPGPWVAVASTVCAELDMMEIAEVSHMRVVPASGGWPTAGTPEADARLMACAPELLAALQHLTTVLRAAGLGTAHADAAIAKATGGAQ